MNTQFLSELNWLAIATGAIAWFLLGALWFSKLLFANAWIADTKVDVSDPDASKGMAKIMLSAFVFMFLTSFALSVLRYRLDTEGWMGGLKTGLLTGVCFGMASISISYLFEKRPFRLHLINAGYTILGNIIAAIIVFSWV